MCPASGRVLLDASFAELDTPIDSPHVISNVGGPQFEASREFGQFVAG
jgi:ribose transport system substrate-binding protein